jgi:phage-related protein
MNATLLWDSWINDQAVTWRIFYRIDSDAIIVIGVLKKETPSTPKPTIELCIERLKGYDDETKQKSKA